MFEQSAGPDRLPGCSRERKKTPFLGKHIKKVTGAVWSRDNILAMAGADRVVGGPSHTPASTPLAVLCC